jgi:predicted flap endonuclease-1-like 5' DNA nuclease
MKTPIEEIEGIGSAYARKLREAGIETVEGLLSAGAGRKGRSELAEKSGIAEGHILRWCNHADLMRIKGIGSQYAELLEAAGVDTVKELRNRNAANLAAKVAEVNDARNISGVTPAQSMLEKWIEESKTLEIVMSY